MINNNLKYTFVFIGLGISSIFGLQLKADTVPYDEPYCKLQANNDNSGKTLTIGNLSSLNVCKGQKILGIAGSAICIPGSLAAPADASKILVGYSAYGNTGNVLNGSMANRGSILIDNAFLGPGYVANATTSLKPIDYCSDKKILGTYGSLNCTIARNLVILGSVNIDQTITTPGYITSITTSLTPADICKNKILLGIQGSADCSSGSNNNNNNPPATDYISVAPSGAFRDAGTSQITIAEETTHGLSKNYHTVPVLAQDGTFSTIVPLVNHTQTSVDCGYLQSSIDERIADCSTKAGSAAIWDGPLIGSGTEGIWKLVSSHNGKEVWRDERTHLIWSDQLGRTTSWCRAAGAREATDTKNFGCSNFGDDPTNPFKAYFLAGAQVKPSAGLAESWCAEAFNLSTPSGFSSTDHSYDDAKGGMRLGNTPVRVAWRLPTKQDYLQAELDGIRKVVPKMAGFYYHTATPDGEGSPNAVTFWGAQGMMGHYPYYSNRSRTTFTHVRCVGYEIAK